VVVDERSARHCRVRVAEVAVACFDLRSGILSTGGSDAEVPRRDGAGVAPASRRCVHRLIGADRGVVIVVDETECEAGRGAGERGPAVGVVVALGLAGQVPHQLAVGPAVKRDGEDVDVVVLGGLRLLAGLGSLVLSAVGHDDHEILGVVAATVVEVLVREADPGTDRGRATGRNAVDGRFRFTVVPGQRLPEHLVTVRFEGDEARLVGGSELVDEVLAGRPGLVDRGASHAAGFVEHQPDIRLASTAGLSLTHDL